MLRIAAGSTWGGASVLKAAATDIPFNYQQIRAARLFDIFDRSKSKERLQKLKEEASRGYWDDFKELKDSKGKVFSATQSLQAEASSPVLPDSQLLNAAGTTYSLQSEAQAHAVTLLCVAFRSGAEDMLSSWSKPFGTEFAGRNAQHIELSLVDSVVMSWWPFKQMILKGRSAEAETSGLKPKYIYGFGDTAPFVQALQLSNRLTGYVFLVDQKARVRWKGSGTANADELDSFLSSARTLVHK